MMKEFISFFKQKVISGLLLLLPVTLIALLLAKLWLGLKIAIMNINAFLGIDKWMGVALLIVLTAIALVLVCFFAGIIAHLASVSIFRSWLERKLLRYLPGYTYIQMMLEERLGERKENKTCVMVKLRHVWQPGLLIEENEYCGVVYLPNCPQPGSGITCIVDKEKIRHLNITVTKLNDSIEHFGEGLADVYGQYVRKSSLGDAWRNYQ